MALKCAMRSNVERRFRGFAVVGLCLVLGSGCSSSDPAVGGGGQAAGGGGAGPGGQGGSGAQAGAAPGGGAPPDQATFEAGYRALLTRLRAAYPNAHILCTSIRREERSAPLASRASNARAQQQTEQHE
ncbi:MAG: hypothetical protein K0R38_6411 [Polyangiaceae bacterium]|nr:hypothetical protein [Polyangiaceae bacterium]